MTLTITICKGLPASGKTTWAKQQIKDYPGRSKRVNKDDLRAMLDCKHHSKSNEKFVLSLRDHIIRSALNNGKHVIVDDTNFAPFHTETIKGIAKEFNAQVIINDSFCDTPLDECIRRDALRAEPVGEKVIRGMYNQYLKVEVVQPPAYNPDLPDAIICDLDGTLSLLNGRNPYDATNCDQDLLNKPIDLIVKTFYEEKNIIFVSGREDIYKEATKRFLSKNGYLTYWLYMRAAGDRRKDYIVKQEIYKRHIENQFNVLFVLDDRNQTVKGWRDLGLTCLQVAEGNF